MKIIAFLAMLLATGITAVTLPNSTTFSIVENGTRIESVQIPLNIANEQMQEFNRSSPGFAEPPKSADSNCVCQDPARALYIVDVLRATSMIQDLCTDGGATPEGVILPPLHALSVTSGKVRITVCTFFNSARCELEVMDWAWRSLDEKCPTPGDPWGINSSPAGFVYAGNPNQTYQREACQDATACGMTNFPCEPVT